MRLLQYDGGVVYPIQHWEGPYGPRSPEQKWPAPRCVHSAACLVDPQLEMARKEQKVIVFWGSGFEALHVPDIWILDVPHMSWKEARESRACMTMFAVTEFLCAAQTKVSSTKATNGLQLPYPRETDGCVCLWREQAEKVKI